MRCIKFKLGHFAVENYVHSVVLTFGWKNIIINRFVNYRPGRIKKLPLAAINIDLASFIEVKMDTMQTKSDLAN